MTHLQRLTHWHRPFLSRGATLLLAVLTACSAEPPKSTPRAPEPVITQPLATAQQTIRLEAVGTARARRSVTLFPEVPGIVQEVRFTAGERVSAGQPLLVLEAREEQLAVQLAQVDVADARRQYQRFAESASAGAVTPAQLDEARTLLERAELNLAQAQERLADHTVRAPFSGVVGLSEIDPGARIDSSTPIASLDDSSELWVRFAVPELFLGQVEVGDRVELGTWVGGDAPVTGQVIAVDSRVDAATRTFSVRAAVTETERLRPGQSFRVALTLSGGQYPAVPEVALQWGGDGAFVWAVEDGRARQVPVSVVQRLKGVVLVDGEFKPDSLVVYEGIQRMRPGVAVRAVANELETSIEASLRPVSIEVQ